MTTTWSEWKPYPRPGRGGNIEAPIGPGLYEVRDAASGDLFAFAAVDNIAQALALLPVQPKSLTSWFSRRSNEWRDLEYRVWPTASKADAKFAAERMIERRQAYMRRAA